MLRRSPTLLSLSTTKINNRLARLAKKLQLPHDKVAQLAVATPSLLTTRVHTLHRRWQQLKELGATHRNWAGQLMAYKAATIGPLLHVSDEKLLRLRCGACCLQWVVPGWLPAHWCCVAGVCTGACGLCAQRWW